MNPKAAELQARTNRFATDVIKFCESILRTTAARRIVEQLIDSAGATDSNYRGACRARSPAEFIAKIGVAAEEADESKGWLELLVSSGQTTREAAQLLIQEADQLIAIFVKSRKTAQRNKEARENLEKQLKASTRHRR